MSTPPTMNVPPTARFDPVDMPLDLGDIEAVRLLLRGNSVIDWNRVHFQTHEEVDQFLRLHLFEPGDPDDEARLRLVHSEAVNYLEQHLGLHFPEPLCHPADVRDVFLAASQTGGFRRQQILACVILKLMHVINHMEVAELRFYTPLSEAELMTMAEARVVESIARLRREGFPMVDFYGSRKERHSVITKLLVKREATAATVFDKLRFRIITEKPEHIWACLAWMHRNLVPVNAVIPGQSHNNLVRLDRWLRSANNAAFASQLQGWSLEEDDFNPEENPFSGASYRMVNFIVHVPVRVDGAVDHKHTRLLGKCVFVLIEFQIMDVETAEANERGENAHELYKERQRAIVGARLRKGARWKRRAEHKNGKIEPID